ncbi:MAG: hypothetical protein ACKPKO_13040 [Candidatus Fonsibacter sp.]
MINGEGFGNVWEGFADNIAVSDTYLKGIAGGTYQTVLFKPLSGILNQRNISLSDSCQSLLNSL